MTTTTPGPTIDTDPIGLPADPVGSPAGRDPIGTPPDPIGPPAKGVEPVEPKSGDVPPA